MRKVWAEWSAVIALLVLLAARYASVGAGELDDFAVLRAGAWLGSCARASEAPRTLSSHLARHSERLPTAMRERYRLRMNFGTNYALTGAAVRTLEGPVGAKPLRAVEGACLLQHLLALAGVLGFAVGWRRWSWLLLGLLTTGLATLWHWPSFLGSLLAFQRDNMTWLATAPRGATVLAWFGALLAALAPRSRASIAIALALALLSVLCHRSMALLCFGSTLPLLGLWLLAQGRLARWAHPRWSLLAFASLVLLAGGLKLLAVLHFAPDTKVGLGLLAPGGTVSALRELLRVSAWGVQILIVLQLWHRLRAAQGDKLRRLGDALAFLLGGTGAVALGLNLVNPAPSAWYGPLFFLLEASQRIGPVPQLLLLALACLTLWVAAPAVVPPATLALAGIVGVLSVVALGRGSSAALPDAPPSLGRLLERGEGAYVSEVTYYSSVAEQISQSGCGAIPATAP